jgi:hypothetical protein
MSLRHRLESQGLKYPLTSQFSGHNTAILQGNGTNDSVEGMGENEIEARCVEVLGL